MKRTAGTGLSSQNTRVSRSAPASLMTEITNHSASGTSAIDEMRCHHQCSTPSFAEPSPIARPNGDFIRGDLMRGCDSAILGSPGGDTGDPGDDCQDRGARENRPAAGIDAAQIEAAAGIPPQMPQPV